MASVQGRVELQLLSDEELLLSDDTLMKRLQEIVETVKQVPLAKREQLLMRGRALTRADIESLPTLLAKLAPAEPLSRLLGVENKAIVLYLLHAAPTVHVKDNCFNLWGLFSPDDKMWWRFKLVYKLFSNELTAIAITDDVKVAD